MEKILIIDDDVTFSLMLRTWLTKKGFEVGTATTVAAGRKFIEEERYDLILSDMRLPDGDGTDILQWVTERGRTIPVIVMTGYAEIGNAVISMKLGAADYIAKPIQPDELLKKIREALIVPHTESSIPPLPKKEVENEGKTRKTAAPSVVEGLSYIEGRSEISQKLYEYVRLVAPTQMSVLINGSSGTGKEHVARLIHLQSKRADKPFIAVDCGVLSRDLAASEFFGHLKGSFTGAVADKTGAFEEAQGGTLFLDEVGNLSIEIQIQLLRVLQERKIKPVGATREVPVDVRLICATNENLEEAITKGTFRTDLYHRINEFVIEMPDLVDRREDVMLYADFFLKQANGELDKKVKGFDPEATRLLIGYDWPGNLRQLKNSVTRATLLAAGDYITSSELPAEIREADSSAIHSSASLRDPVAEQERIRQALAAVGGNKSQAARLLGIDRKTHYNKLHFYRIE